MESKREAELTAIDDVPCISNLPRIGEWQAQESMSLKAIIVLGSKVEDTVNEKRRRMKSETKDLELNEHHGKNHKGKDETEKTAPSRSKVIGRLSKKVGICSCVVFAILSLTITITLSALLGSGFFKTNTETTPMTSEAIQNNPSLLDDFPIVMFHGSPIETPASQQPVSVAIASTTEGPSNAPTSLGAPQLPTPSPSIPTKPAHIVSSSSSSVPSVYPTLRNRRFPPSVFSVDPTATLSPTTPPVEFEQSVAPTYGPSLEPSSLTTTLDTPITMTTTPTKLTNIPSSSRGPSEAPSAQPASIETSYPTTSKFPSKPERNEIIEKDEIVITYQPGNLNATLSHGLRLSEGLQVTVIANKDEPIQYANGRTSLPLLMHRRPDMGATFTLPASTDSPAGWIYVSNSEVATKGGGSVGAFTFDGLGRVISYQRILKGTTMNCAGGRTPWNTWVSCEEVAGTGQVWQVDPLGVRPAERMAIGLDGGRWESFAYDIRDRWKPRFYVTEDLKRGALRRFTPTFLDDSDNSGDAWTTDPWSMLHGNGTLDYLLLAPSQDGTKDHGTFSWTSQLGIARANAETYYRESEGIDVHDGILYFVSKRWKTLYILDLDGFTYVNITTKSGLFDGTPDQVQRVLHAPTSSDEPTDINSGSMNNNDILYFTEEGGKDSGIHGRNEAGQYFTILESPVYNSETTGLAFSPDGRHMYFAYQEYDKVFDVTRVDGLPFYGKTLDVKYHATEE